MSNVSGYSKKIKQDEPNHKLRILFVIITILLFLSIIGFSFSILWYGFNWEKELPDDKTDMVYSYVESNAIGNGIAIENAFPISDSEGKILTGQNYTLNFTVTFYPKSLNGTYQIAAVKTDDSTLPDDAVKLYLTSKSSSNGVEREISNSISQDGDVKNYSEYKKISLANINGAILFSEKVTRELINNHNKYFTLRMWLDEDVNFDSSISNKAFKVKVNFYGLIE